MPSGWLLALVVFGACTEPLLAVGDAGQEAGVPGPSGDGGPLDGTVPSLPPMQDDGGVCEGPACPGDATPQGQPDAKADAEMTLAGPDSGLDPIRARWVGRYATRSFLYSWDGLVEGSARFLTLAEIKPSPDGKLVLEEELCLWSGGWVFVVTSQAHIVFPGTKASSELVFTADGFDSMQAKAAIGYGPAPSGCTSGVSTVAAQPGQVWLSNNTCDCPRNADVPSSARDCRLTDTDRDNKPGYTFVATLASSRYEFHVAQEERLRLMHGYRVNDQLFAEREFLDTTQLIACTVDGVAKRTIDCPLGGASYCPPVHNKTEFVRFDDPSLGCAAIIQREEGLFTKTKPPFPAICPSELGI